VEYPAQTGAAADGICRAPAFRGAGGQCLREIEHDGYRMIVRRYGKRARPTRDAGPIGLVASQRVRWAARNTGFQLAGHSVWPM
jgi:hypothetical protein